MLATCVSHEQRGQNFLNFRTVQDLGTLSISEPSENQNFRNLVNLCNDKHFDDVPTSLAYEF